MTFDNVYRLCNKHDYFTCGCTSSYDRLFELVRNGASIEVIASVIWCNSDEDAKLEEITEQLLQFN